MSYPIIFSYRGICIFTPYIRYMQIAFVCREAVSMQ